jgi:hypothetical protein
LHYEAQKEIKAAIAACDNLIAIQSQMIAIRPTPADYCLMADLVYRKSNYYAQVIGPSEGRPLQELLEGHRVEVERAIDYYEKALALPDEMGEFGHLHESGLTRDGAKQYVAAMQKELIQIDERLAKLKAGKTS